MVQTLTRIQILTELKRFFTAKELFCPHTINRFGKDGVWFLMPTFWAETLIAVRRDILQVRMLCNDDKSTQRGCRCNLCQIVKDETSKNQCYQSPHTNNIGNDFILLDGMTAEQARKKIVEKQLLLPYNIRLESDVSYLHIDGYDYDNGKIVNFFKG